MSGPGRSSLEYVPVWYNRRRRKEALICLQADHSYYSAETLVQPMSSQQHSRFSADIPRLWLWSLWVLATSLSGILSIIVADLIALQDLPFAFREDFGSLSGDTLVRTLLQWIVSLVCCLSILLGLSQGFIISLIYKSKETWFWTASCFAAVLGSMLISIGLPVVGLMFPGLILGYTQSLVLRRLVQYPGWWVAVNGVAWVLSLLTGFMIGSSNISVTSLSRSWPFFPYESALQWGIGWGIGATIFACLTGVGLVFLPLGRSDVKDNGR
jgi:hypothetical protein